MASRFVFRPLARRLPYSSDATFSPIPRPAMIDEPPAVPLSTGVRAPIAAPSSEASHGPAGPALLCPLCDYNLTGLAIPQCPECGHTFEWDEITNPARMNLKWLFEHRQWLGGYVSTQFKLLRRPVAFWNTLRPSHKVVPKRLVRFWLVGMLALVAAPSLFLFGGAAVAVQASSLTTRRWISRPLTPQERQIVSATYPLATPLPANATYADWGALQLKLPIKAYIDKVAPLFGMPGFMALMRGNLRYRMQPFSILLFPQLAVLSSLLVLLIMRESFSRIKVRPVHTLRVTVYAADVLPFAFLLALPLGAQLKALLSGNNPAAESTLPLFVTAASLLATTLWLVRFHAALKHYLGLPHRPAILAATLIITFLTMAITYAWIVGL